MELEKAIKIFDKIKDICYEVNHSLLNEALPSMEVEVNRAESPDEIAQCASEILCLLEEATYDFPEEEENLDIVRELMEKLYDT